MALDLKLQQKMSQQLVMTPQLQQAIKLLQLSHLDLMQAIQQELEENPLLEEMPDDSESETPESEEYNADDTSETLEDASEPLTQPDSDPYNTDTMDWDAYQESNEYTRPAENQNVSNYDTEAPSFESRLSETISLQEHLLTQISALPFNHQDRMIAAYLIQELDERGYLNNMAVEFVAETTQSTPEHVETILHQIQRLDPIGVAARNVQECLIIQADYHAQTNPLVLSILQHHIKLVEKRNIGGLAKALQVSEDDVIAALKIIRSMNPYPAQAFTGPEAPHAIPDVFVRKIGNDYVVLLNQDGIPQLGITETYHSTLKQSKNNDRTYLQDKIKSASWLIRSLHMRQRTIYRVMESILKFQRAFFEKGPHALKPLVLRDIAEDVGMHESTISRVTSNKYVHTPLGIFEMRYFFNSAIAGENGQNLASESVREQIAQMIAAENPKAPISDQKIAELLASRKIDIARRTVAKYREMLKIPTASERKKIF